LSWINYDNEFNEVPDVIRHKHFNESNIEVKDDP